MDVGRLRKARSGSDFLDYGTGDVRIKTLGDQDEDVDIDDGDTDAAPHMDSSVAGGSLLSWDSSEVKVKRSSAIP